MNQSFKSFSLLILVTASMVVVISASWHSLEELHFLKSFYPDSFSVADVFYASAVELIRVMIISLPFCLVIWVSLHLLGLSREKDD